MYQPAHYFLLTTTPASEAPTGPLRRRAAHSGPHQAVTYRAYHAPCLCRFGRRKSPIGSKPAGAASRGAAHPTATRLHSSPGSPISTPNPSPATLTRPPPTRCTSWGFDRRPHLLSLIGCSLDTWGCSLQHTWLQVGGYRRPRPAQRDRRWASMSESGWRAAALCATESRGAQLEAVVRPWAQAEAADSAALDTQARRSPATSCAPTRARASLPGWPTASCNCSLKTPRSPARSALLSRWPYAAAARRPRATPTAPQHVHPIAVCLPYLSGRAGHLQPGARGPCSAALGPR